MLTAISSRYNILIASCSRWKSLTRKYSKHKNLYSRSDISPGFTPFLIVYNTTTFDIPTHSALSPLPQTHTHPAFLSNKFNNIINRHVRIYNFFNEFNFSI